MSNTAVMERLDRIETALQATDLPLNFKQAAHFLSCSPGWLYKLTHRKQIRCFKPGGKRLFFRKADLEAFIYRNPAKTAAEIEQAATDHVSLNRRAA